MVVRRRDGEGVIVELARDEAADHEVARLEGEMDRRGLVDAPGDRLEVTDVERERVQIPVPADQVEGVEGVVIRGHPATLLHLDHEVARLVPGLHFGRWPDVALAVRGVLEHLAVLVPIPLRRLDV